MRRHEHRNKKPVEAKCEGCGATEDLRDDGEGIGLCPPCYDASVELNREILQMNADEAAKKLLGDGDAWDFDDGHGIPRD